MVWFKLEDEAMQELEERKQREEQQEKGRRGMRGRIFSRAFKQKLDFSKYKKSADFHEHLKNKKTFIFGQTDYRGLPRTTEDYR